MERKLASIQTIKTLEPIEGADFIEKATFTSVGWQCVVQKGEFKIVDPCIYIEIDSVVPETPDFEFMRNKKFKVKTLKLKGTLSQGLAVPVTLLAETGLLVKEGEDVTEIMGIKKFEPPVPVQLDGELLGHRPSFVYKTQEMRVQSMPGLLDEMAGREVYISTKIDGTSMSVYYNGEYEAQDAFGVCNRNWELKPSQKGAYWRTARKLGLMDKLTGGSRDKRIVIQGELAGPGINKNRLELKDTDFFVFTVWVNDAMLSLDDMVEFCNLLDLSMVPIEETFTFNHSIDWLLERAKGKYAGTNNAKEGIVLRPLIPVLSPLLDFHHLSMKVINNDYLLKDK
jgi:RNA ligase (TIGR02306 family)